MGNDGGSIPTRRELVKEAARHPTTTEIKESQHEQQEYYWTTDPISSKPLARPVVSDASGKLYNKDTILEYLVEGKYKDDAEKITHGAVKSLKDVVDVKFEIDTEATNKATQKGLPEVWKCPVTGDRLGPGSKAVYLVPCGHAFSGNAIKEVSGERCLTCETEYAPNDVIPILSAVAADIARLSLRVKTLQGQGLSHSLKKASSAKKRKKKDEVNEENVASISNDVSTGASNINNASTATLTAKVMQEQEKNKKRRKENENVRSLFSSKQSNQPAGQNSDFMTRGYSVPQGVKR